ncbi:MAG: tetratricopeptide repeat protein [Anaerolineaceae bacterium]
MIKIFDVRTVQKLDHVIDWCYENHHSFFDNNLYHITSEISKIFDFFKEGINYENSMLYSQAIEKYQLALDISPDFENARFSLARVYRIIGQSHRALQEFQTALNYAPEDINIFIQMGLIYSDLNNKQSEVSCYLRATQLSPNSWDAFHNLGTAYREMNELIKAEFWLQKTLELISKNPLNFVPSQKAATYLELGNTLALLGKYQESEKSFLDGIAIIQNNININQVKNIMTLDFLTLKSNLYSGIGRLYFINGKWDKSVSYLEMYLKLNPNDKDIKLLLQEAIMKKSIMNNQ